MIKTARELFALVSSLLVTWQLMPMIAMAQVEADADIGRAGPDAMSASSGPSGAGGLDCVVVSAADGDSIQRAANRNPRGARLCLTGTFTIHQPIEPKSGQRFIGPATITRGRESPYGFDLTGAKARNVTLKRLEIRGFQMSGVRCWVGTTVRASNFHDNLRNGIGCGLDNRRANVLVVGNEIWRNGSVDELGRGAGGMKFARSGILGEAGSGVTVRGNNVHDNIGEGIWFDIDSAGDNIIRNVVADNSRSGIMYEISLGPVVIKGNEIHGNNTSGLSPSGGVVIYSSRRARVTENVFGNNENWGVKIRSAPRGYRPRNIRVDHNGMRGDAIGGCELDGVRCWRNRR